MPTNMPQQPPAENAAPASQPEQPGTGGEQPTPQEQQNFEKVVLAGMKILYAEQTHQGIMQMLSQGKNDPSKAMADVVTLIMGQLDKRSGGKIPQVVILPAAAELLGLVAELATAAKLFQADERAKGLAMQKIIMVLADRYGVSRASLQKLMQSVPKEQMEQMVQKQASYGGGRGAAQPRFG